MLVGCKSKLTPMHCEHRIEGEKFAFDKCTKSLHETPCTVTAWIMLLTVHRRTRAPYACRMLFTLIPEAQCDAFIWGRSRHGVYWMEHNVVNWLLMLCNVHFPTMQSASIYIKSHVNIIEYANYVGIMRVRRLQISSSSSIRDGVALNLFVHHTEKQTQTSIQLIFWPICYKFARGKVLQLTRRYSTRLIFEPLKDPPGKGWLSFTIHSSSFVGFDTRAIAFLHRVNRA